MDFKDYFFATYEIPEDLNTDFVQEGESYLGKIATDIYIPGEHFFANFTISTLVELKTIKSIKKLKACSYVWRGTSEYSLNLANYFITDNHFFTKIVNKESNLYRKSTLEIFNMAEFSIF